METIGHMQGRGLRLVYLKVVPGTVWEVIDLCTMEKMMQVIIEYCPKYSLCVYKVNVECFLLRVLLHSTLPSSYFIILLLKMGRHGCGAILRKTTRGRCFLRCGLHLHSGGGLTCVFSLKSQDRLLYRKGLLAYD